MNYKQQKQEVEKKFNQVKNQLDAVKNQARQLNEELLRLQGEHRFIAALEEKELKTNTKPDEAKP